MNNIREEVIQDLRDELESIVANLDEGLPENLDRMSELTITVRHRRTGIFADEKLITTIGSRTGTSLTVEYYDEAWRKDDNTRHIIQGIKARTFQSGEREAEENAALVELPETI